MKLIKWNTEGRKLLCEVLENGCIVEVKITKNKIILEVNGIKYELSELAHKRLIETRILEKIED